MGRHWKKTKKQKTVAFASLKFSHHLTLPIKPTNLTIHSKYHKILSRLQKKKQKNVPCKKLKDIKMNSFPYTEEKQQLLPELHDYLCNPVTFKPR